MRCAITRVVLFFVKFNIAFCSCSNYPAGFFNAYKEIAKNEGFRTMSDMGREMIISGDLNFREFDRVLSMD